MFGIHKSRLSAWRLALGGVFAWVGVMGTPLLVSAAVDSCTAAQLEATFLPLVPANEPAPNCRYGASASAAGAEAVADLQIGWVVSFGAAEPAWLPAGVAHTPMIRLHQLRDTSGQRLDAYTASPALTEEALGSRIAAAPGAVWIVGNEVDRLSWQDDLMPEIYAVAYHDAYHFIKQQDPTAQVAVSGLVMVSPGRLQYLDKVLDAYRQRYGSPMPVDVWTFHAYIFPERNEEYYFLDPETGEWVLDEESGKAVFAGIANGTDPALALQKPYWKRPLEAQRMLCQRPDYYCIYEHDQVDLLAQQVVAMRGWMKANGYQRTPLLLTEWSLLYQYMLLPDGTCAVQDEQGNCFTPERVTQFLRSSVAYLETAADSALGYPLDNSRLVQQWAWFTLDALGEDVFTVGNPSLMVDPVTGELTQMGREYRTQIAQRPVQPNLVIDRVWATTTAIDPLTGTAAAQLRARVRNNGNTPTKQPFEVTFFREGEPPQEIGRATVAAGLEGCAGTEAVVELLWEDLAPGAYLFSAVADLENVVGSGDLASRVARSAVLVDPDVVFLPLLQR